MIDIENLKQEILDRLKPLKPYKVILFGSYAHGTPHSDSDIDLYVVTRDEYIPQTFRENIDLKLKISRTLKELQEIVPIDIITHTKAMHRKFVEQGSSFSKEILSDGVKLYG